MNELARLLLTRPHAHAVPKGARKVSLLGEPWEVAEAKRKAKQARAKQARAKAKAEAAGYGFTAFTFKAGGPSHLISNKPFKIASSK